MDKNEDLKIIKEQIKLQLRIEDVASDLMGAPASYARDTVKWNIVYKSIYNPSEKTPSFKISTSLQIFHCYSSGQTGDVIKLYKDIKGITSQQACDELIKQYNLNVDIDNSIYEIESKDIYNDTERNIIKFYENVVRYTRYNLINNKYLEANDYLNNRKVSDEMIKEFHLGYFCKKNNVNINNFIKDIKGLNRKTLIDYGILDENGNFPLSDRIIIPLYDTYGNIVSLCGRSIRDGDKEVKYKKTQNNDLFNIACPHLNTNLYLYNFHKAKTYIVGMSEVIIVEGYFDVIRLWEKGIYNVVALETTSITDEKLKQLSQLGFIDVTALLDGDSAGQAKQLDLLEKMSSIKASHNNQYYVYTNTYFIDDEQYIKEESDPNDYFQDKTFSEIKSIFQKKFNYRNYKIKQSLDKYKNDSTYEIVELYHDVGKYIIHYNPLYTNELEEIIESRGQDQEQYEILFANFNTKSLYLSKKLDLEIFYCEKLLNEMKKFETTFRNYETFMNDVYLLLNDIFVIDDSTKINKYYSFKNLKLYGDKSTRIVIDVIINNLKCYSYELDYMTDKFYIMDRYNKNGNGKKRNEHDFFENTVYEGIQSEDIREKIMNKIRIMLENSEYGRK